MYYGYTLDNYEEVLATFEKQGFDLNLSGHIHAQDIKSHNYGKSTIYDIVTGSMAIFPVRYGILEYQSGKGYNYNTAQVDVEGWARSVESKDENILNFDTYSKGLYTERAYNRAYERLSAAELYSEDEKIEMAKTMSIVNTANFSGDTDSVKKEILNTKGYKLWVDAKDDVPMKDRVLRMMNGPGTDNNSLQIRN
jgi:hypothetical protein